MNILASTLLAFCLSAFSQVATTQSTRVDREVIYKSIEGVDLKLDIHRPADDATHPAVIYVHGGGWSSGDKAADFGFNSFTDAGLVVVSINYRLAPDHRWPACREDVSSAIQWVKDHAAEHGIDPNRLAIMGYSAGGHLAMDAATRETGIRAAVAIAAPTDLVIDNYRRQGPSTSMQNLFKLPAAMEGMTLEAATILYDNSPINHITANHPPTLLVAGDADKTVPHSLSEHYKARLEAVGVRCELLTMPGAGHRLREYRNGWETEIARWLADALKDAPPH